MKIHIINVIKRQCRPNNNSSSNHNPKPINKLQQSSQTGTLDGRDMMPCLSQKNIAIIDG